MLSTQDQLDAVLIVFVLSAAFIDWRTHRIPNVLCAAGAMLGLALQAWLHGEAGLFAALGGISVGFALFVPFYLLGVFGAGDVKAMATVGIFLGVEATLLAVGMTFVAGAAMGAMMLWIKRGYAKASLHRLLGLLLAPAATARNARPHAVSHSSLHFPYGIAIACGTAVALLVLGD